MTVRLVQPDADQALKWQPGMAQILFDRHLALTAAEPRADITVWSETAAPFLLDDRPDLLAESAAAAAPGTLILGIQRSGPAADGTTRWFNSLAVLDGDGRPVAVYDKHHLVPFGEYIPLVRPRRPPRHPGAGDVDRRRLQPPATGRTSLAAPGVPPFLPLICYEAIFPQGPARAGGAARVAAPDHQRRLVRRSLGALPALRPGPGAGDRAGIATCPSSQYRN